MRWLHAPMAGCVTGSKIGGWPVARLHVCELVLMNVALGMVCWMAADLKPPSLPPSAAGAEGLEVVAAITQVPTFTPNDKCAVWARGVQAVVFSRQYAEHPAGTSHAKC